MTCAGGYSSLPSTTLSAVEGEIIRITGGGSYEDTLARTAAGWRITERKVFMKWKETRTVSDEITRSVEDGVERG